ncbi:MAG TPA: NUDIX domain-containing protein [Streptosporangiaceae bacterium]
MDANGRPVADLLRAYRPAGPGEQADLDRCLVLADGPADPWSRARPLHFTASALIVDPAAGRVLLRWHQRHQAWLQVGGHGDPGETDALAIALREGTEETGLPDLAPWPDDALQQLAVVAVPAGKGEPAHAHADLRFLLATGRPAEARAESDDAPLRWLRPADAASLITEANLIGLIHRAGRLLGA